MRRRAITTTLALLLAAAIGRPALAAGTAATPGAAPSAVVQPPVTRTLDNGLTVAVFPDRRQPVVQIQLLVPAGSADEGPGEAGLASLTAQMLSQGTTSRTAVAYATEVEALGGSVGGAASREFTTVSGAFLAGDFEAGLELLADAVVHPIFDEQQLVLVKTQMANSLMRTRQSPGAIADELLWAGVYAGHPYGHSPFGALRTLPSLGLSQVRAFHRQQYRPDHALLAIAGDVTPERAFQAATEVLGSWGGHGRTSEIPAPSATAPGWRVRIVDAPGLTRVVLHAGGAGPSRTANDRVALEAAAELLEAQAGESARQVRVTSLRGAGLVSVTLTAPVDSAGDAVARLEAALTRAGAERPSETAMAAIRKRLANGYPLTFETRGMRMAQWMGATYAGQPISALESYPARVEALTAADVQSAASKWMPADRGLLIAIGPADRLKAQLARFGTVEIVPPEGAVEEALSSPSTETAPPTEAQLGRGRALVKQTIAAHGGLERLRGIKDSTLEGDVVMVAGGQQLAGQFLQVRKEPSRFLFSTQLQILKTVQVLDGDHGWSQAGSGAKVEIQDQDSLGVRGLQSGFRSDLHHLLLTAADTASRVAWRGRERVEEREADVVEVVAADGDRRVLFLDPASHLLLAMEQGEAGHSARRLYSDVRLVNGVQWPFHEERLLDGQPAMALTLKRVAFNTGIADELFRRPGGTSSSRKPRPR
jgi:predicted Zn-dependent peptidase